MAAILARLPRPEARLDILHNLFEEHGELDPSQFQEATFRRFLASIGACAEPLRDVRPGPGVLAFNATLDGLCFQGDVRAAVAALGVIEYAFADISACIGQRVVARGFVAQADLVHYSLHAAIDKRHAAEFFAVVAPEWHDPAARALIEDGLAVGVHAFGALYDALAAA